MFFNHGECVESISDESLRFVNGGLCMFAFLLTNTSIICGFLFAGLVGLWPLYLAAFYIWRIVSLPYKRLRRARGPASPLTPASSDTMTPDTLQHTPQASCMVSV